MILIILIIFLIIAGIFIINESNEKLLIILGCIALTFTGIGSIIGIPILWAISRIAFKHL